MWLPYNVMLKSLYNKKTLRLAEESKPRPYGYLQFAGEGVFGRSAAAKFELEQAECDSGLVHIRCCYNNKYWVRLEDNQISSTALKPEEDQSKKFCTLFKPLPVDDQIDDAHTLIRLLLAPSGHYVCLWKQRCKPFDSCLYAIRGVYDPDSCDVFAVVDVDLLVKLPRYVAFKGENDRYLGAFLIQNEPYLTFSFDNKYEDNVPNEVLTNPDGTVRIRSVQSGKFWAKDPDSNLVLPATSNYRNSGIFSVFKIDDNRIALCYLSNNRFCEWKALGSTDPPGKNTNFLCTVGSIITKRSILKVEDLASSRKIYNIKFRLKDARIYNQSVVLAAVGAASNNTNITAVITIGLPYADTKVSSWKSNAPTLKNWGVKTTIDSGIPRIVDESKFQLVGDFRGDYEWPGETKELTTQKKCLYSVNVEAKRKVTVKLMAKAATYDIPFSYTQQDTLVNGTLAREDLEDGLFTGSSYYDYQYEVREENL